MTLIPCSFPYSFRCGLLLVIFLTSCASTNTLLKNWGSYSRHIDQLDPLQLTEEKNQILELHNVQPDDELRLKLGYLLSRPNTPSTSLTESSEILAGISPNSPYKSLALMIENEINLQSELERHKHFVEEQKLRIDPSGTNRFVEWAYFVDRLEEFDAPAFAEQRKLLEQDYEHEPTDKTRMQLAYLLRQTTSSAEDLQRSQQLLIEIKESSVYLPLKNMLQREVDLRIQLHTLGVRLDELDAQLALLKSIDDDLSDSNRDVDELAE